jgi:hypothetical protein
MDAIEKLRLALGPNGSSESAAQESLTMAEQHLAALLSPGADLPVP